MHRLLGYLTAALVATVTTLEGYKSRRSMSSIARASGPSIITA